MPKIKKEIKEEVIDKEVEKVEVKPSVARYQNIIDFTGKFEVVEIGNGEAIVYNEKGVRVSKPISVDKAIDLARQSNLHRGFK